MKEIGFNKFKNRKKKKKRLSTKFLTVFFIPFFFGTLISTIVVIVYINISHEKLINNIKVQNTFENSKEKSSIPIILNAKFFIFDYIQKYINNLIKIREYYLSLKDTLKDKIDFEDEKKIMHFFFNAINDTEINNFKESYDKNNESKFTHAKWFINKEKKYIKFNENDTTLINQLYYFSYLIPLLKTIIEISEKQSLIYIISTLNNLMIKYPIEEKYMDGSDFNILSNTINCLKYNENIIDYYFYKCRPYYRSMKISKKLGYNFTISDVYKFIDGNFGITICIQFEDIILINDNTIIICQDININNLITILNNFNSKLDGYFFITKINSNIPIYYPFIFDIEEYNEISKMEFTLNNKYYMDEISKYKENLSNLTQIFKENKYITFDTYKNGQLFKYIIYPIFFDYNNNYKYHFLSIIYVRPKIISIEQYQDSKITNIYISILFSIMALIQLLLTKYLISSLAKNLIKPIKLIKKLLETDFEIITDNSNNTNNLINNNNYLKKNNSLLKDTFINENSPLLNHSNISTKTNENETSIINNYITLNNNFFTNENFNDENNSLSSSSSNDDEDENNKYKSNNIQKLFVKFIDLKNSFKNFDNQNINDNLPYLVHSQNIFNNINNINAFSTCQSNISSFFIKNKEFDKAISHLNEGIRNIRIKILNFKNQNELKRQIKTENLTNRYLKLFYCYKSYFKYIKKINKRESNKLINSNFYIEHHIEKYKKHINDYIELINKINDEKELCIALLEKVEELIEFEIIPSKNNIHNINNNELSKKQNQIKTIIELFKQIDKLNDNKFIQNYNIIHLINILKYEPEIVNAMDIPPSILIQRTNYLKGKFYFKCSHYKKAIFFFENSLIYNKVGNIRIIISSIKKLIKISKIYLTLVNNDIEIHKNESKYKYELRDDKQRKQILLNYINNLKQEINIYKYIKKDICFILNLSNISSINSDRFHNIHKVLINIYENILTYKDRLSIIAYIDGIFKFIIDLKKKTIENDNFIFEQLNNIQNIINIDFSRKNSTLFQNSLKVNESILSKSIQFTYKYLKKKQMGLNNFNKRENWYIYLTNDISINEIKCLQKKPLKKYFNSRDDDNLNNLVILFYENIKIKKELLNWLKYNKSCVIIRNEIDKLKNIMGTNGEIQNINFDIEKYKDLNNFN